MMKRQSLLKYSLCTWKTPRVGQGLHKGRVMEDSRLVGKGWYTNVILCNNEKAEPAECYLCALRTHRVGRGLHRGRVMGDSRWEGKGVISQYNSMWWWVGRACWTILCVPGKLPGWARIAQGQSDGGLKVRWERGLTYQCNTMRWLRGRACWTILFVPWERYP